ncbi:hypothetical protein [Verrucomicrobium spinosum]|uniref:hypothetical protein n=1 Tax=Verrucomicrobium spinosum TaxID=2736 RepID=UPI0001746AF0|nr:hypothetical protein [Verrucomicrobium spinosum]
MKSKFLFAFAGIALALGALAPTTAKADHYDAGGYYVTRFVGYDHCGRPVYQKVWVPVCRPRPVCPPPVCNPRPICPPSWGDGSIHIDFGHRRHHHHCR